MSLGLPMRMFEGLHSVAACLAFVWRLDKQLLVSSLRVLASIWTFCFLSERGFTEAPLVPQFILMKRQTRWRDAGSIFSSITSLFSHIPAVCALML